MYSAEVYAAPYLYCRYASAISTPHWNEDTFDAWMTALVDPTQASIHRPNNIVTIIQSSLKFDKEHMNHYWTNTSAVKEG